MGITLCLFVKIVLNSDNYWRLEYVCLLDTIELRPWTQIGYCYSDFLFIDFFHAASAFYHSSHTKMQFYKNNDAVERNVAWSNWSHVDTECIALWILLQKFSWHPSEFAVAFLVPCLGPVATHIDRMPTVCQAVWTQYWAIQTRPLSAYSLTVKPVVKQVRDLCWILWK